MIRLYCDQNLTIDHPVDLAPAQAHYLANVMRKKIGDSLYIFNGTSGEWRAQISALSKKAVQVRLLSHIRPAQKEPDIWLIFAPIKKQRLDFLIEKATELGVSRLIPVLTRHTMVGKIRKDRLESQVIEASEQCERLSLPVIEEAQNLKDCLENWSEERNLYILSEKGGEEPMQHVLKKIDPQTPCAILVGPEGGFDRSELDVILKKPFVTPVSLGPRILRAETAAIAALTCWQSIMGDWQSPLRNRKLPVEE